MSDGADLFSSCESNFNDHSTLEMNYTLHESFFISRWIPSDCCRWSSHHSMKQYVHKYIAYLCGQRVRLVRYIPVRCFRNAFVSTIFPSSLKLDEANLANISHQNILFIISRAIAHFKIMNLNLSAATSATRISFSIKFLSSTEIAGPFSFGGLISYIILQKITPQLPNNRMTW